jgi:hypothetical protein
MRHDVNERFDRTPARCVEDTFIDLDQSAIIYRDETRVSLTVQIAHISNLIKDKHQAENVAKWCWSMITDCARRAIKTLPIRLSQYAERCSLFKADTLLAYRRKLTILRANRASFLGLGRFAAS